MIDEHPDREPVTVNPEDEGPDAEAKKKEFLRRIHEHEETSLKKYEQKLEEYKTDREQTLALYLARFWRQATWIETMQQFPDGRPLSEQRTANLGIWNIFIRAISRRRWGGKSDGQGDYGARATNDSGGGLSGR